MTFSIPAHKCGLVIGRGGENVKSINQQTGAFVEISRQPPPNGDPNFKLFIIRGSPQQIDHAKQLIEEKIEVLTVSIISVIFRHFSFSNVRIDAFLCFLYIHLMCNYVMCFRVLSVPWARGQVDQVLLVQWVLTTPIHTTPDHLGRLDHHSEYNCPCSFTVAFKKVIFLIMSG